MISAVVGAVIAVCAPARAAVLCSDPASELSRTDVSFSNAPATQCFGVVPGVPAASNLGFDSRTGFGDFSLVTGGLLPGSTTSPAIGTGEFLGIDFTLGVSERAADIGNWSLAWTGTGLPATLDIVAVIQTSLGSWGSYLFSDLLFSASGSGTGSWVINLLDPAREGPASLVAFSLFARGPIGTTPEPTPTPVSEPGGLALTGLALMALLVTAPLRSRRPGARGGSPAAG